MLHVSLVKHPLSYSERENLLAAELNEIEERGGTILYITSDSVGYTIVYREKKKKLNG